MAWALFGVNFCARECFLWEPSWRVLRSPVIFLSFDFCFHSLIPVTWNSENPRVLIKNSSLLTLKVKFGTHPFFDVSSKLFACFAIFQVFFKVFFSVVMVQNHPRSMIMECYVFSCGITYYRISLK